ncbi:hypothetical protein CBL_10075 [Carabus blaptoides fortunei]
MEQGHLFLSRKNSIIRDRNGGLKFELCCQMRSGGAETFFGNTCVLMAVIFACYDVDDIEFMMSAGEEYVVDPSRKMADLFNLEHPSPLGDGAEDTAIVLLFLDK